MKRLLLMLLLVVPLMVSAQQVLLCNGSTLQEIQKNYPEGELVKDGDKEYYTVEVEGLPYLTVYVIENNLCTYTTFLYDITNLKYVIQMFEKDSDFIKINNLIYAVVTSKRIITYYLIPDFDSEILTVLVAVE